MRHNRRAIVLCDQWLGSNGYAGMKALRRSGWSVRVAAEWEYVPVKWKGPIARAFAKVLRPIAVREFNRHLLSLTEQLDPSLFLAFKGTFVQADTLRVLRAAGVRCYCFYPDVSAYTHGPYIPRALPQYDVVFTTKSFGVRDMKAMGVRDVRVILHAFDPDLHRPIPLSPQDEQRYCCDVSFIGTWSPKKERVLNALIAARPKLSIRIWGAQWERASSPSLRAAIQGHDVEGHEYVKAIIGSRINLGILSERRRGASDGDHLTSRTFHIPASGGFLLHERTRELLDIFVENESVACYSSDDELIANVDRFLRAPEERLRIAAAGRSVVQANHSWDHRIREIVGDEFYEMQK